MAAPILALRPPRRLTGRLRAARLAVVISVVAAWLVAAPGLPSVVSAAADPVVAAAGDIACDPLNAAYNGGNGTPTACDQKATSNLLVGHGYAAVLALGDTQYYCGALAAYQQVYANTWGRLKSITHPVPGNHEYLTSAAGSSEATGCNQSNLNGAGYFGYFGSAAGTSGQGWYSFNVGAWHLIALNSNCGNIGGCSAKSPEGKWLVADLAAHPNQCVLAYWHIPLFSSGGRASSNTQYLWQALYAAHADLVLDGHDHIYERFAPQTPAGLPDPVNGITQITVGTGGSNHTSIASIAANSVVRNTSSYGILAVTLHASSFSWKFVPATGSFTDSGSASCHNASGSASASPTAKASGTAKPTPTAAPTTGNGGATFTPVADATVDASQPTTNFGTATTLRVDGSPVVRSYLRFTVTGVTGKVTSATLRLLPGSSQSTGFAAHTVANNTWGETTITAANAPAFGASLGSSGPVTSGAWASASVTAAVTGNGTYSFAVDTSSATAASFSSRQGATPPQLVITTSP